MLTKVKLYMYIIHTFLCLYINFIIKLFTSWTKLFQGAKFLTSIIGIR